MAIWGAAKDPNNKSVSGATVTCTDSSTGMVIATTTSDSSGRFSFNVVGGGDYRFTATENGEDLQAVLDKHEG